MKQVFWLFLQMEVCLQSLIKKLKVGMREEKENKVNG